MIHKKRMFISQKQQQKNEKSTLFLWNKICTVSHDEYLINNPTFICSILVSVLNS